MHGQNGTFGPKVLIVQREPEGNHATTPTHTTVTQTRDEVPSDVQGKNVGTARTGVK